MVLVLSALYRFCMGEEAEPALRKHSVWDDIGTRKARPAVNGKSAQA